MAVEIEAAYKAVTPMFCGGADPQRSELRLSSFKGVLRYWWRALAWTKYKGDLNKIRERENKLFGSAEDGQSLVTMRLGTVDRDLDEIRIRKGKKLTVNSRVGHGGSSGAGVGFGVWYLGYGVMNHKGELSRECFSAPFEFQIQMRVRVKHIDLNLLQDALIAVGVFGGMGAKSRKGYGSLVLRSLIVDGEERWNAPRSASELENHIKRLHQDSRNATLPKYDRNAMLPKYTAFSAGTRHLLVSSKSNQSLELLNLIGRELIRYRSWGRNGKILGNVESERNFQDDHDLMKDVKSNEPPNKHPRRVAFGLPHNYGKKQIGPAEPSLNRRASPLFIHIHECGDKPVAVLSFIPARFLPEGKSDIRVGGKDVRQALESELYQPICEFLDRLLDPEKREEKNIERVGEVKP
ncbi:MAG: type III-B CRISPR module RAMP protein Cmr1 [Acidimicrobiaceae bacterium]|nr:type III-B CRISPR module RAMP protein Cmr1 [Acidimicrobiaceae bacterium]